MIASDVPDHWLNLAEIRGLQKSSDEKWNNAQLTYWGFADLVSSSGRLIFQNSSKGREVLVIFSDMRENAGDLNLDKSNGDGHLALARAAQGRTVPDLKGVEVYVLGADNASVTRLISVRECLGASAPTSPVLSFPGVEDARSWGADDASCVRT